MAEWLKAAVLKRVHGHSSEPNKTKQILFQPGVCASFELHLISLDFMLLGRGLVANGYTRESLDHATGGALGKDATLFRHT